jgi:hypothetical protein
MDPDYDGVHDANGWRAWLPALLLAAVAVTQIVLAHTTDLSPWKGGGFGMFATIDGTAARHVRLFVRAPDRSEELAIQPSFENAAAKAELFPSYRSLKRLADAVASRERRYQRAVAEITVQVWRSTFDAESLRATERLVREETIRVAESAPRLD